MKAMVINNSVNFSPAVLITLLYSETNSVVKAKMLEKNQNVEELGKLH